MTLCPFEDAAVAHLAPLAYTRGVFDLRVGARTLLEGQVAAFREAGRLALHVRGALAEVVAAEHSVAEVRQPARPATLYVNGRWRATHGPVLDTVRSVVGRDEAIAFYQGEDLVAFWDPVGTARTDVDEFEAPAGVAREEVEGAPLVSRLWHLVEDLEARISDDISALGGLGVHDQGRVRDGARIVGAAAVHLGAGATLAAGAIVSAEEGPVRIEAGAVVEEHAVVRGPCWIGPGATVRAGAQVDGSSIGPRSKVGGEIHASVLAGLSNKAHAGYLGNSYVGEWCNLGAGTDTSNLRNDYGEVTLWDPIAQDFLPTGRTFLGLIMADHSKCAIGTRFNTGTLVGVSCNWFGAGFAPRRLPSFSWGDDAGLEVFRLDKAIRVAEVVMARRGRQLSDADRGLLGHVFDATAGARAAVFGE